MDNHTARNHAENASARILFPLFDPWENRNAPHDPVPGFEEPASESDGSYERHLRVVADEAREVDAYAEYERRAESVRYVRVVRGPSGGAA